MSKFDDGKFFNEIEAITKTFYINKNPSNPLVSEANDRSKSAEKAHLPSPKSKHKHENEETPRKNKKSIWNWRALKALSHIGNRKFKCCFTLQVHSIEELPSSLDGLSLLVHWKRHDEEMVTCASKVLRGRAEFEEKLTHTCSVYGSKRGSHNSVKYEGKYFSLYASVLGAPEHHLGNHRIDLTRLLPLALEELEDETSSGNWTTSYKLSGKAKGAIMNASFGYFVIGDNSNHNVQDKLNSVTDFDQGDGTSNIQHVDNFLNGVEEIKDLHEVLPTSKMELANSVNMDDGKLDEEKLAASIEPVKRDLHENVENEREENNEFYVVEHGVELSSNEHEKLEQAKVDTDDAAGDFQVEYRGNDGYELSVYECGNNYTEESLLEEFESALNSVSNLETAAIDDEHEMYLEVISNCETSKKGKSHSLDDDSELVANEFLNMLQIEHSSFVSTSDSDEPESPRELLLRQFEEQLPAGGGSLFDFDVGNDEHDNSQILSDDLVLTSVIQEAKSKIQAKILEDLETEFLMQEWGLNEKAFEFPPPRGSTGIEYPIDLLPEEPHELPPLGEGFGPVLQTNKGGFMRSMNPSLFRNATNGGSLIMQVSCPIVLPAEMGSGVMEILQRLASIGIEKLSMQANKLMPLEDVSGKNMQQIAWEAGLAFKGIDKDKQCLSQHGLEIRKVDVPGIRKNVKTRSSGPGLNSSSMSNEMGSKYVSLEKLAPLAMEKIEALSLEGLRIQSGMSDSDAPSNISTRSNKEMSALLRGEDELMGLSLTLDEWVRLDSGEIDDEDQISDRISKILAAHHVTSLDSIRGGSSRNWGLLGNNFTVSLMMQLHNPLRNYDLVGAPMLALIQVERFLVPPKTKIYSTISDAKTSNREDDDDDKKFKQEGIPQFKITEVHVAGLKTKPGKKKLWGSRIQQQSGSRWLLANGMGKSNKHPFMKSKAVPKTPTLMTKKVQPGDTLWSISSLIHGTGAKWKELAKLNSHIRNPDIIFPNETIRLF